MDVETILRTYFSGEKSEAALILLAGTACLVAAVWLWFWVRQPFARGLALSLLLTAALGIAVGGSVYFRTDAQVRQLVELQQRDPGRFASQEGPRIREVVKSFGFYRLGYAIAVLLALVCRVRRGPPGVSRVGRRIAVARGTRVHHRLLCRGPGRRLRAVAGSGGRLAENLNAPRTTPRSLPLESVIETEIRTGPGPEGRPRAAWLREPLLHFLLIGAALFLLYRALNGNEPSSPRSIVVSESRVEALAENFAKTWMRPPSAPELKGLVDDYVAEEVYYREAVAMGLDRDDTVIRRRLRQKMEFVTDDVALAAPATDPQLQAYLDAHRDKFLEPARYSFQQVFLSRERRGETVGRDAERVLAQLRAGKSAADAQSLGDATMLPPGMESATPQDIDNTYGSEFADAIANAPPGQWTGPVSSGYGVHLLKVDRRDPGALPPLAQVRAAVEREWEAEQRRKAKDALLQQLMSKYDVRIEGPLGDALRQAGAAPAAGAAR